MIKVFALSLLLASCTVYETKSAEFKGLYTGLIMGFKFEEDADGISRRDSNTDVHFIKDMSTNSMLYGKWMFSDTLELDAGLSHVSDTFHPDDEYYKNQLFLKLQKCVGYCK